MTLRDEAEVHLTTMALTTGERQKSKKNNLFRAMDNKFYRWLLI